MCLDELQLDLLLQGLEHGCSGSQDDRTVVQPEFVDQAQAHEG